MQTTFIPFKQTPRPPPSPTDADADPTPDWRLQAPFGAGLRRARHVKFVPASTSPNPPSPTSSSSSTPAPSASETGAKVSTLYLSLVGLSAPRPPAAPEEPTVCADCALPIAPASASAHASSTAHLAALPHAHPPHPYDRSSKGLKVLISSGWDPDARVGLGRQGEGVRYPVKAVPKEDKLGVGLKPRKGGVAAAAAAAAGKVDKTGRRLGVKEARRRAEEGRRRRGRLMGELAGGADVQEVLGRRME